MAANYALLFPSSTWSPERVAAYDCFDFPVDVTVPQSYGGGTYKVDALFRGAFGHLQRCAARPACNKAFRDLGGRGGRLGLVDILNAWRLNIYNFGPTGQKWVWPDTDDGVTYAQVTVARPNAQPPTAEIGVHICALRSAEFLAATLLHELAHLAGAPGAAADDIRKQAAGTLPGTEFRRLHQAEAVVLTCGMHSQYKPAVIGAIDEISTFPGGRPV